MSHAWQDSKLYNLIERLKTLDREASSHVGGSGGRYQCTYCLRDEFPEADGTPKHWPTCEVFLFRELAAHLAMPLPAPPSAGAQETTPDRLIAALGTVEGQKATDQLMQASANNINWGETIAAAGDKSRATSSTRSPWPPFACRPCDVPRTCPGYSRTDRPAVFTRGVGHMRSVCVGRSDIGVTPHMRPVLREHLPAKGVNLHLPLDLEACPLKPQIEPADPGEQATHRERLFAHARLR